MLRKKALEIAEKVKNAGGRAYYVGGCVRDFVMGRECFDTDMEIHGIEEDVLEKILSECGKVLKYGKSFAIYSLADFGIDIALPRSEVATGRGHRDFDVTPDPYLGTLKAAKRRDFTVNALMQDVITGEITDHFGGLCDIKEKKLRHVNDSAFSEDPLRVMRLAQFAARLDFEPCEETLELCRGIDLSTLSSERVFDELKKALLKSDKPSVFFETLRQTNGLDVWFPEVKKLIGTEQNPKYHLEGDVWTHTMMVLDYAVKLRDKTQNPLGFMLCALFHDLGKTVCTTVKNGEIHSYNHETEGLPLIEKAMNRITKEKNLTKYVLNLSSLHMKPKVVALSGSGMKTTNRMFDEALAPFDLICISEADNGGKLPKEDFGKIRDFLTERYELYKEIMSKPFVDGRDLIEIGFCPGESFRELMAYAHKLRLAGVPKDEAIKQVAAYGRKL